MASGDKSLAQDSKTLPLIVLSRGMAARENVIAVVDDSDIMRDALDQMLASCGYRTELYASAEEFIRSATATPPHVWWSTSISAIFRDRSSCATWRRATCTFPSILMSGSCDATLDRLAAELGCLKFLRKPFAPAHLLEAIAQALSCASPVRKVS